jgi:DNA-directed RNA polymerase specialized sigma24 family protein
MTTDRPALETDEIEITDEMIEAGLEILYSFSRECDLAEDVVSEIYSRMYASRPKKAGKECTRT